MNEEELRKYKNYLIKTGKYIKDEDTGRYHQVSVDLQLFVDDAGNLKLVREAP
jgi:hypothetical protein